MRLHSQLVLSCIVGVAFSGASLAQQSQGGPPLSIQQAVAVALEKNTLHKAALAETRASSASIGEARSLLLPHLNFTEAMTRGNDPVYVFGSRLRQQRFTAADFALNKLNTPAPLGNFSTQFGGSWTLFDSFANWHRVRQSKFMNQAANQQLDRSDQEVIFRVIASYYEVLLAGQQVEVSQQSLKAAQSIVDSSQARLDSGLSVESDLLTAKVRLAARQQDLIRSTSNQNLSLAKLNTAMGVPADSAFQLTETLADRALPAPTLEEVEARALANRPDLKRISSEAAAQRLGISIAKSSFGPQVSAFAAWQLDNPTFLAGGGGNNWLGGIEVKFDLFDGGARRAEVSRQNALADKAAAIKQAATDAVRLEIRRAYYDVDASRQQVEVARAAIAQARESFRINQDRYSAGLTPITDLLSAEEASRRSQADYWETLSRFYISYADLELSDGTLTSHSPVVMP